MVLGCRDPYFIGGGPYSSVLDGGLPYSSVLDGSTVPMTPPGSPMFVRYIGIFLRKLHINKNKVMRCF